MANTRQTLRTVSPEYLQFDTWPMPSLDDLSPGEKQRFHKLAGAIRHYIGGGVISQYLREINVHREQFYRAFDRCVAVDVFGKPMGWIGLLSQLELKPRRRRAPIADNEGGKGGLSGALEQFLRINREVRDALYDYLNLNAKRKPGGEVAVRHKSAHIEFLRLCRIIDPNEEHWPFTSRRQAAGSIRDFVNRYLRSNYDKIVATQYGDKAATKAKAGNGYDSRLNACMPFDILELDEHAAGFIGSVKIETPEGTRIIDAGRVHILLLVERHKGWILGFKIVFRDQPNSGDVLDVLHAGMIGEPGYAHHKPGDTASRPLVELDARFAWCGANCVLLDNALIHLADEVVSRLMALAGCSVNFGPVHSPARRQLVERIFNSMERAGFKRLRTTTGSGPLDPKKQNPEAVARQCTLSEKDIVQLAADIVNKHNNDIGKKNLAASAFQRMRSLIVGDEQGQYLFPFLPPLQAGEPDLSISVVRAPIRGNEKTGRRPYFSFLEADYTSVELAADWDHLKKWAVLHVSRPNIRFISAFVDEKPVGECQASGRWRHADCSVDLRKYINQLLRHGYLENDRDGDVIAEFARRMGEDASSTKAARKNAKSSVRQWGDHLTRREDSGNVVEKAAQTLEAEQAVNDLLTRANESNNRTYLEWDDIGAFNGDSRGY